MHPAWYLDRLDAVAAAGGGWIDADTSASAASARGGSDGRRRRVDARWTRFGGARGRPRSAPCGRPAHHATPTEAMGFCLVSNIAVVAAALADAGERVWILDIDAHHGNGTQDVFYERPAACSSSALHQWPLYPGTGPAHRDRRRGRCRHHDEHPAAAGRHRRRVPPRVRRAGRAAWSTAFAPTWLLVSAGFDAHRDDPLTELGLAAADFAALTARAMALVPAGRTVAMLEGGYDLEALAACTDAFLGALAGERPHTADGEGATNGGPGHEAVDAVCAQWARSTPG